MRNLRPHDKLSDTKSSDHRWFGPSGSPWGLLYPRHACVRPVCERLTLLRGRSGTASSSLRPSPRASAECATDDSQSVAVQTTALSIDHAVQYPLAASTHVDRPVDQSQPTHRPAFGCTVFLSWPRLQHCVATQASKVFSQHFLQRRHVHHLFSQQLLQFGVLGFKRLQFLGIRHFHAAILGTPFVKGRIADTMLAAKISGRRSCLMFLQYPNNRKRSLEPTYRFVC
jgi:hypothetical protein